MPLSHLKPLAFLSPPLRNSILTLPPLLSRLDPRQSRRMRFGGTPHYIPEILPSLSKRAAPRRLWLGVGVGVGLGKTPLRAARSCIPAAGRRGSEREVGQCVSAGVGPGAKSSPRQQGNGNSSKSSERPPLPHDAASFPLPVSTFTPKPPAVGLPQGRAPAESLGEAASLG